MSDLLLNSSLLAECSEWSDAGSSTSHDDGDRGIEWWMEGLLGWTNAGSDPHSWLQVGKEVCRSPQVYPFLGDMLSLQDCDCKGDQKWVLQRGGRNGVLSSERKRQQNAPVASGEGAGRG